MKLFLWIPLTIFGWYKFLFSDTYNGFILVLLLLATALLLMLVRQDLRRASAANNIVAAAATFSTLDAATKERVHNHAVEIIQASGWPRGEAPPFMDDAARFGWYALSMGDLGIPPVCLGNKWTLIRNPYIAISVGDKNIVGALWSAKLEGFDVSISRSPQVIDIVR